MVCRTSFATAGPVGHIVAHQTIAQKKTEGSDIRLVSDIVEILSGSHPDPEDALIKTKVLVSRLAESRYFEWVNKELTGYGKEDDAPDYRVYVVPSPYPSARFGHYTLLVIASRYKYCATFLFEHVHRPSR